MAVNILDFLTTINNIDLINYLISNQLFKDSMFCAFCNISMANKECTHQKIGFSWRYMNGRCEKYQTAKTVFKDSYFARKKLDPRKVLKTIYYLSTNTHSLILKNI
ncbi:hypothetical protein BDAP_001586 [Binucleata daphniae]